MIILSKILLKKGTVKLTTNDTYNINDVKVFLKSNSLKYFTIKPKASCSMKLVIKGLPSYYSNEEVT